MEREQSLHYYWFDRGHDLRHVHQGQLLGDGQVLVGGTLHGYHRTLSSGKPVYVNDVHEGLLGRRLERWSDHCPAKDFWVLGKH